MSSNEIAVISDIHGNADALNYVLKDIEQKKISLTIILGDLLTYGCQPNEVIDTLISYKNTHDCIFIKGNHEEFYANNFFDKSYKMPDFVRESIAWTASAISGRKIESIFEWRESFVLNNIFFSHANPYEYGNWEYVDNDAQHAKSYNVLRSKGFIAGIFGHSHRAKIRRFDSSGNMAHIESNTVDLDENFVTLVNAGSIGQPRGTGFTYLLIDHVETGFTANLKKFSINLANSEYLLNQANISDATKQKLLEYLRS